VRAVFIGGAPRSGTTFLGSLLGAHPACVATPESSFKVDVLISRTSREGVTIDSVAIQNLLENAKFKTWELELEAEEHAALARAKTVAEVMSLLALAYARATGRKKSSVWVDHTPSNIRYVDRLQEHFARSKFIHLIRDGRAVSASVLPLNWGPTTIVAAARDWLEYIGAGLAAESKLSPGRICRVRYEDLVGEPERELRRLCDFLELDFRDSLLYGTGFQPESYSRSLHPLVGQPPRTERISAWQGKLKSRDIEIFESRTGDVLACLGYDLEFGWKAGGATFFEVLRMYLKEGPLRAANKRVFRRQLKQYAAKAGPR
jgi:hypothetical protein